MPAEARAAVSDLVDSYRRRIAEFEQRPGRNSTNSSRPRSSDPRSLERRPPAPPSGKKRGGHHKGGDGLHHRQVTGAEVARGLFGTDARRVVVSDRFKSYG